MFGKGADPLHLTFLAGRTFEQIVSSQLLVPLTKVQLRWWSRGGDTEQFSAAGQVFGPMSVAQEPRARTRYRERYEELTGVSLHQCPQCKQGRMLVIEILPRSPCMSVAPIDSS